MQIGNTKPRKQDNITNQVINMNNKTEIPSPRNIAATSLTEADAKNKQR